MRLDERLGLASQAYARALSLARAKSTPASWARVLAAARNLRTARRDQERRRSGAHRVHASGGLRRAAAASPPAGSTPPRTVPRAVIALRPRREIPPDVLHEWERSRELRERARVLVEQARALRSSIAELVAKWPWGRRTAG